jgi:hypothetical protein
MSQLTDLLDAATSTVNPHAHDGRLAAGGGIVQDFFDRTVPASTDAAGNTIAAVGAIQDNFRADTQGITNIISDTRQGTGRKNTFTDYTTNYYAGGIKKYNSELTIHTATKYKPLIMFKTPGTTPIDFFNRYSPTISATITDRKVVAGAAAGTTYYCTPGQEGQSTIITTGNGFEGNDPTS